MMKRIYKSNYKVKNLSSSFKQKVLDQDYETITGIPIKGK